MLTDSQQSLYSTFHKSLDSSGYGSEFSDSKTASLIGLSSAYFNKQEQKTKIPEGERQDVQAKVMRVAAGQKRLQAFEVLFRFKIEMEKQCNS